MLCLICGFGIDCAMVNSVEIILVFEVLFCLLRLFCVFILFLRFCWCKSLGVIGVVFVVSLIVMVVFVDRIVFYFYDELVCGVCMKLFSAQFWMGIDNIGWDIWSCVVYGVRILVIIGFIMVAFLMLFVIVIGVSSAYFGGVYDIVVQCVVDVWIFFFMLVIVFSLLVVFGFGFFNLIFVLSIIFVVGTFCVICGVVFLMM